MLHISETMYFLQSGLKKKTLHTGVAGAVLLTLSLVTKKLGVDLPKHIFEPQPPINGESYEVDKISPSFRTSKTLNIMISSEVMVM